MLSLDELNVGDVVRTLGSVCCLPSGSEATVRELRRPEQACVQVDFPGLANVAVWAHEIELCKSINTWLDRYEVI